MSLFTRDFGNNLVATAFYIPNGQAFSDIQDLHGTTPVGIYVPAEWSSAAIVCIYASPAPVDMGFNIDPVPIFNGLTIQSVQGIAGAIAKILPADWLSASYQVKLGSGAGDSPVNQTLNGKPVILLSRPV